MKQPPYHLKVNKAIDRFLLVEILNRLKGPWNNLSGYTYYGFGGPFLEDCRLIHDRCPEIKIVSIERDEDIFKRQKFHSFSANLDLIYKDFDSFIADFSCSGGEIFWLDYTNLDIGHFDDFKSILQKVSVNSIVKITVRAECPSNAKGKDREKRWEDFREKYSEFLPEEAKQEDIERVHKYINLLQDMLLFTSQDAFDASDETTFQLLNSSYYKDRTRMLSITGIVCNKNEVSEIERCFEDWKFTNLEWKPPNKIDVPFLSIKERLYLEKYLPTEDPTGCILSEVLDYKIDGDEKHENLKQYQEFYQYYPYFARVSI